MLNKEEVSEIHDLICALYNKYPDYVHFDLTYSTEYCTSDTLPPNKSMKLNIYTPLINHNSFTTVVEFQEFVKRLLNDGVPNVRIKLLLGRIANCEKNISNDKTAIVSAKTELEMLKEVI